MSVILAVVVFIVVVVIPCALVGCVAGRITGLLWEWLFKD